MKFSVLMSIYYKETKENLIECLESLINQTLIPNEIVIIKDGLLTNDLDKVIDEYNNKYKNLFTIVCNPKNQGLGYTLKQGVELCKYELIARMDTDDIAYLDRFEKQIEYFKNNENIDILGSDIEEFDHDSKKVISTKIMPKTKEDISKYIKLRNPLNHMTVMFKKSSVLKAGNYEPFQYKEDYYLWAKMFSKGMNIVNISNILVKARVTDNLYKRRGNLKSMKSDFKLQKEFLKLGITDIFTVIYILFIRLLYTVMPNSFRKYVYQKKLRKKGGL